MKTLKENYKTKKLNELKSKVKKAEIVFIENRPDYHATILLEALDADEYKKATEVIEKLRNVSKAAESIGLKILPGAIENCVKDINEFTGGGTLSRIGDRLASLFSKSAPEKNPILRGLSFVSALEAGFKVLPDILKNNIKDMDKKMDDAIVLSTKDDPKVQKTISDTLIKSFVPSGTFGKISKKIPYVENAKQMVFEIIKLTPNEINKLYEPIKSGPKTDEIDATITDKEANAEAAKEIKKDSGKEGEAGSGKAQTGKTRTILVKATQDAAKKAGISNGKALMALMKKMGYEVGSYEATLVMPALQELMAEKNIDDEQTDGFIRGLMTDFEKEFKNDVDKKIQDKMEKVKANATKGKSPAKLVAKAISNLN